MKASYSTLISRLRRLKKRYLILAGFILLLIVTNPSKDRFKNTIGISRHTEFFVRHNYLVFSTFEQTTFMEGNYHELNYFGCLTTFWIYSEAFACG